MKKISVILALLLALSLLAACGKHEHQWEDATCDEPETCSVCGETRGDALGHRWKTGSCTEPETCARCGKTRGEAVGHDWQAATCDAPETCSRCGETRGEPLGHDWQDPSCTEPAICSRCGETDGEPLGHDASPADYWSASVCERCGKEVAPKLTPDFVTYGLDSLLIEAGKTYNYNTICYDDTSYSTVGKATVTRYEITPGDGDKLEKRDGYEWRIVTFEVVFDDDNANNYGMSISISTEDYYDIRFHDNTLVYNSETGHDTFDVFFKGQTYSCERFSERGFSGWSNRSETWTATFYTLVPVGYDGVVIGIRNRGVDWPDGAYVFELDNSDSLYFRLS